MTSDATTIAAGAPSDTPAPAATVVRFHVYGVPSPQGSKTPFINPRTGKPGIREAGGQRWTTWRHDVGVAAFNEAAKLDGALDGALELGVTFRFSMPASRQKWVRRLKIVPKTTTPDLSKLVRALEDSLESAGLIANDARFARIIADKVEVDDSWSGADITIRQMIFGGLPAADADAAQMAMEVS